MYRESWVEIDCDSLKKNIETIKQSSNKELICVIKANGYGSGDQYIIQTAMECGIHFFAVSSLDEALVLRNEGCNEKILILGYVNPKDIQLCIQYRFSVTVISLSWLQEIIKQPVDGLAVHIKVDTGMNRIGIKKIDECQTALNLCTANKLNAEGIFTHFACSDDLGQEMTISQFNLFKQVLDTLNTHFEYIHCDNSDALLSFKDDVSNYGRLGISMYGVSAHTKDLEPVFSLFSSVSCIKEVEKNQSISYGATYTTSTNETIATLPIGYADGWLRKNQGRSVYINGEFAPIVGRICMDQCMIRCEKNHPVGTRVELFGKNISLEDVAHDCETIPYEIITNLSERLTRVYIKNKSVIASSNARLERSCK